MCVCVMYSQGYTDVELEAACVRCDVDGSHMIDKKELAKLSRELTRKQQVGGWVISEGGNWWGG